MTHILARLAPALPLVLLAMPLAAQDGSEKVNQVTVYDEADCPEEQPGTITSCIVITGESPFRIPSALRTVPDTAPNRSAAVQARKLIEPVSGFASCSAAGVASYATCSGKEYEAWKAAQGKGSGSAYAELIEKERRTRLGLIDTEAADQQAIVDAEAARADGVVVVEQVPPTGVDPNAPGQATLPAANEATPGEVTQPVPQG